MKCNVLCCTCSAIVSKMAETEIDYMIQQLVETKVSIFFSIYVCSGGWSVCVCV